MITVENINKHFAENQVLTDVSFVFESGKTNLIIGESGSGKTTLLKIMIGLLESDSGVVNYNERNFTAFPIIPTNSYSKNNFMVGINK